MERLVELVTIGLNLRYIDGIVVMDQTMDTLETIDRLTSCLIEPSRLCFGFAYNDILVCKVLLAFEIALMNLDLFNLFPLFVEHLVVPFALLRDVIWGKEVHA